MEDYTPSYAARAEDFERVWSDYERAFGERPPAGYARRDYDAAVRACRSAILARIAPDIKPEPVKEWPSQAAAKKPDATDLPR